MRIVKVILLIYGLIFTHIAAYILGNSYPNKNDLKIACMKGKMFILQALPKDFVLQSKVITCDEYYDKEQR